MGNLAMEHAIEFFEDSAMVALGGERRQGQKIEVIYIEDEVKFVNDERNKKLNESDGNDGVRLYYLPF